MKNIITKTRNEAIAKRARHQARQLNGRLFVSEEGLYIVSGMPVFTKLQDCLSHIMSVPEGKQAPIPLDLGFSPQQILTLNNELLTTCGRALQKWRKNLDTYQRSKHKNNQWRRKYQIWAQEIESLSQLLDQFWNLFHAWEKKELLFESPYVLQPHQKYSEYNSFFTLEVDPLWIWYEKLIVWISGGTEAKRFALTLQPFNIENKVRCKLFELKKLLGAYIEEQPRDDLIQAIHVITKKLPVIQREKFEINLLSLKANEIIESYSSTINEIMPGSSITGSAAALCSMDGGSCLLSPQLFTIEDDGFATLFKESKQPGYELLLQALLNDESLCLTAREFCIIRQLLYARVDINDIAWAINKKFSSCVELAEKGLTPKPFRLLHSILEQTRVEIDHYDFDELIEKVAERGNLDIVESFVQWLLSLESTQLQPSLVKWAWNCLQQLLIFEGNNHKLTHELRLWVEPPISNELVSVVPSGNNDIQQWLVRLHYYQQLSGKTASLPKSLEKLFFFNDKEIKELNYLRQSQSKNDFNKGMAERLKLLESRISDSKNINEKQVLKKTQEVCAHFALEAIKHIVRSEGLRVWKKTIDCEPPAHLSLDEMTYIAAWSTSLDKKAFKCLQELISQWHKSNNDYCRFLSANQGWIKRLPSYFDSNNWFNVPSEKILIEDTEVHIKLESDPFRIFLMGSYFDTCLSLDRENRHSVLANAYEMNKAVVFVYDTTGNVLARKLIAISSNHTLIGYRTYVASDHVLNHSTRKVISDYVDGFCGQLARNIGIELSSDGQPKCLANLFWYDDGSSLWGLHSRQMRSKSDLKLLDLLKNSKKLMPVMDEALKLHHTECIQLLVTYDLIHNDDKNEFTISPGLSEELLALLARKKGDQVLAQLVFDNAMTQGGKQVAMESLGLLNKSDEMVEFLYNCAKKDDSLIVLDLLLKIGTEKALKLLMKHVKIDQYDNRFIWIPLIALKFKDSETLVREKIDLPVDIINNYNDLFLVNDFLQLKNKTLFNSIVFKALIPDSIYENRISFELAQWLPTKSLKLSVSQFEQIAYQFKENEKFYHFTANTAVIAALKIGGASSASFLKSFSRKNASALLGLALLTGVKQRQYIKERALSFIDDSAAILALLLTEGKEKTIELVTPFLDAFPDQQVRLDNAIELVKVFHDIELGIPPACIPDCGFSASPFVLQWLWKWMDLNSPNYKAITILMGHRKKIGTLCDVYNISYYAMATRIAYLTKQTTNPQTSLLRNSLLRLMRVKQLWTYAVFLDQISQNKLLNPPRESFHEILKLDGDFEFCSGLWDFFFDDAGDENEWCQYASWGDEIWNIALPMEPDFATNVVKMLHSHAASLELQYLEVNTEWQKLLISKYDARKAN